EDLRDADGGEDLRRVPAGVLGDARGAAWTEAGEARRRDRDGLALPAGPDGPDPRFHRAQARPGQDRLRASRHGEVHAGDVRDHGVPGADHADRLRDGGLHHGRGGHPAPGHGQEGSRAHGQAARQVPRRLRGPRHPGGQGRARLGVDGEVRGLRVQQVPHRRHVDRDGQRHAQAERPMLWAAPVAFVLEGTEPTYDIEVPGAGSFIANGIAVHNSHAGAYALVAYQTAYFKANYPVEFMAALLTSEMGDTDKIVKYIEECRAMGLTVSPPDVNVSAVQFSVAGDTIRFGLAA